MWKTGLFKCFGDDSEGQIAIPVAFSSGVDLVEAGGKSTCVISEGETQCFGALKD